MAVQPLCVCLLLAALLPTSAEDRPCLTSASSCSECIRSGPRCAWCSDPRSGLRCQTEKVLRRAGCPQSHLYNPQGGVEVVRNDSSREPGEDQELLLQPRQLSLRLRPGTSTSFSLTVTRPTDPQPTELTLDTGPLPAGVSFTFSSVTNGTVQLVQGAVEAARCHSEGSGPWSVHVTPRGSAHSVTLALTLECECECAGGREEKSPSCSGRGALECGRCVCDEPYEGPRCRTPAHDVCRPQPDAPVCSGRGRCSDGQCECLRGPNPEHRYSGRFCECSDSDCPEVNHRVCGGRGRCVCGRCVCDDDWTGDDCGCSMDTASCGGPDQQLCSGRGTCQCGVCRCEPPFAGPTCESCPVCPGACELHAQCVECRAFGTGVKKDRCDPDCSYLNLTLVERVEDTPPAGGPTQYCRMRSHAGSLVLHYTVTRTPTGVQSTVVRARPGP